jgi:hypothetical protein
MRGYRVREVEIDYDERRGETTLDPLSGGLEIAGSIVRVAGEEWVRRLTTDDGRAVTRST